MSWNPPVRYPNSLEQNDPEGALNTYVIDNIANLDTRVVGLDTRVGDLEGAPAPTVSGLAQINYWNAGTSDHYSGSPLGQFVDFQPSLVDGLAENPPLTGFSAGSIKGSDPFVTVTTDSYFGFDRTKLVFNNAGPGNQATDYVIDFSCYIAPVFADNVDVTFRFSDPTESYTKSHYVAASVYDTGSYGSFSSYMPFNAVVPVTVGENWFMYIQAAPWNYTSYSFQSISVRVTQIN